MLGLLHADHQWAVAPAQVLAGIVQYPRENPFYIVSVKAWTLVNQLSALLLYGGMSERTLSFLLSGVAGMVSFVALGVFMLALSRDRVFAAISPFFVFFVHGVYSEGVTYPITLLGTDQTYGMLGLSFSILVVGLIASGRYRPGGFLLGIAPAVHPTQGLWLVVVVVMCLIWDYRRQREVVARLFKPLVVGALVSTLSLGYHLAFVYDVSRVESAVLAPYLTALKAYWSEHYFSFQWFSFPMMKIVFSTVVAGAGLVLWGRALSPGTSLVLRSLLVSTALAAVLSFVYWIPAERTSDVYPVLMLYPARAFNYAVLASWLLLLALLRRPRWNIWSQGALLALVAGVITIGHSARLMAAAGVALIALMVYGTIFDVSGESVPVRWPGAGMQRHMLRSVKGITVLLMLFVAALTYRDAAAALRSNVDAERFRDWTTDPFWAELSRGQGMLLGGPTETDLIAARTRRPVLFHKGPLILNYAPEGAPELNEIFRKVYGVDFLHPPAESLETGRNLPVKAVSTLWRERTLEEWKEIKHEFGVADVVVNPGVTLQLPEILRNQDFVLYRIP